MFVITDRRHSDIANVSNLSGYDLLNSSCTLYVSDCLHVDLELERGRERWRKEEERNGRDIGRNGAFRHW